MRLDLDNITTVTFDSYSTLLDVNSTEAAIEDLPIDAQSVAQLWRRRSLEYVRICNFFDDYKSFYELNRLALDYALKYYGIDLSTEEREKILSVYHELDVFGDVFPGMERLSEAGYDLWVISNGNPEMLDSLVEIADIGELIEGSISADEIERYKPDPNLYRHAAGKTGTPINEILHVTAGWIDVMGAMNAGMQSAWVNRQDEPWETFGNNPSLTIETFDELVERLV